VTTFRAGRSEVRIVVEGQEILLFSKTSIQSMCARQHLTQWVPGFFPGGGGGGRARGGGNRPIPSLHIVLRLGISGKIFYSPCMPSWSTDGQHNDFTCRRIATNNTVQNILGTCVPYAQYKGDMEKFC